METSADQGPLNVVVDASKTTQNCPQPTGWLAETHIVEPLTFIVHEPPRTARTARTAHDGTASAAIITFPDIGQGEAAFAAFFHHCRRTRLCTQLDSASAHFHTAFPGHHTDSPNLHQRDDVSMGNLVSAVISLIDRFSIKRVVGLGVGLGATVLLRAAAAIPPKFSGLVLISPIITPSSMLERIGTGTEGFLSNQLGMGLTRRIKDRFLTRWLSDSLKSQNFGAVTAVEEDLDRRNANNVFRLLAEDSQRADASQLIQQLDTRALLITGKESSLHYHVSEYITEFNSQNTSWLDVPDVGSLVHDEAPDKVAKSISLFLQGIPGYI